MTDVTAKIELSGDFFRRDPGKTFRQNVRDMLDELAAWMESQVAAEMESHAGEMPNWTGWSDEKVQGYTTSAKTGKRWGTWAAVGSVTAGMSAKDAIRTKAAAATIEQRWHPYRKVKSAIYRARPLLSANLTKGLDS